MKQYGSVSSTSSSGSTTDPPGRLYSDETHNQIYSTKSMLLSPSNTPIKRSVSSNKKVHSQGTLTTHESAALFQIDHEKERASVSLFARLASLKYMMTDKLVEKQEQHFPIITKVRQAYANIPAKYKYGCFLLWVVWKVSITVFFVYVIGSHTTAIATQRNLATTSASSAPTRVLYIVTSLAEYNNGRRSTVKGQDRFHEVLLPVLVDSVESMTTHPYNYQVDVFLILAYTLRPDREEELRNRLPGGLQVWNDACPLGYDKDTSSSIVDNTRALSRQHRYVIKEKFEHYDLFMAWEDDMRITGQHVEHFINMSNKLERLRLHAPTTGVDDENMNPLHQKFFGSISQRQANRLIPGFVRVEVLVNETEWGAQKQLAPIPLDYMYNDNENNQVEKHFDPTICCHVQMKPNIDTPVHPQRDQVVIWETSIKALSARQLPFVSDSTSTDISTTNADDWIILLPGPGKRLHPPDLMGGYWSGRKGAFAEKPSPGMPDLIAQQGGWMATRKQLWRLHTEGLCEGTFLPPFDEPVYRRDGQESMNVEFWSGGYQFFTGVKGGCNMQRVVSTNADEISKHFIYHVANNKQKQLSRERMLRADHLVAQINSLVKMAQQAKEQTVASMQ